MPFGRQTAGRDRSVDRLARALALPVVARLPAGPPDAASLQPAVDAVVEAIAADVRSVAVTAPQPRQGKTAVVAALATGLAARGLRTAAIDADPVGRTLAEALGADVAGQPGWLDLVGGRVRADALLPEAPASAVRLVPHGRGADRTANGTAVRRAVLDAAALVDVVLLNAPALATEDVPAVAAGDAALLVVSAEGTTVENVRQARDRLDALGVAALGVVLTATGPGPVASVTEIRARLGSLRAAAPDPAPAQPTSGTVRRIVPPTPPPEVADDPARDFVRREAALKVREAALAGGESRAAERDEELRTRAAELEGRAAELDVRREALPELEARGAAIAEREAALAAREQELRARAAGLDARAAELDARAAELAARAERPAPAEPAATPPAPPRPPEEPPTGPAFGGRGVAMETLEEAVARLRTSAPDRAEALAFYVEALRPHADASGWLSPRFEGVAADALAEAGF